MGGRIASPLVTAGPVAAEGRFYGMVGMTFVLSEKEIADLIIALRSAQGELCTDHSGSGRYPEGTAQWDRWEELVRKLVSEVGTQCRLNTFTEGGRLLTGSR